MEMSVREDSVYHEEQKFRQVWMRLLVAGLFILCGYSFVRQIVLGKPFGTNPSPDWAVWVVWVFCGVGLPLLILSVKLIVDVKPSGLAVRYFPMKSRFFHFSEIREYRAVRFQPLRDFGGWGIRYSSKKGLAYLVGGNEGVELVLQSGKRVTIGSVAPARLVQAMNTVSGK
jgi:hypothetical protein